MSLRLMEFEGAWEAYEIFADEMCKLLADIESGELRFAALVELLPFWDQRFELGHDIREGALVFKGHVSEGYRMGIYWNLDGSGWWYWVEHSPWGHRDPKTRPLRETILLAIDAIGAHQLERAHRRLRKGALVEGGDDV